MSQPVRRLVLRTATGADLDVAGRLLRELNLEVDDATPSAQVLASRLAELLGERDTEVLLGGDPPAGIAVLRLRRSLWTAHREAALVELWVRPARRDGELERALVQAALAAARDAGADFVELTVGASEVRLRRIYESFGFDGHELGVPGSPALAYALTL